MSNEVLSHLIITKVYSISNLYSPQNTRMHRTNRQRWSVVIKYEGETTYTSNGKTFLSDINHIVVLPKSCSYDWHCSKAGHYFSIEFECNDTYCEPISFAVKNGEKILKLFRDLEFKRNLKKDAAELESIRDLYTIIISLMQAEHERYVPGAKQKKIAPAVEFISQHYNEKMTNDSLAGLTGMSTVYFRKLFSEVMGVPPIDYVHKIRIEKAKEMLKSDYVSLSDMALSLGYPNLYDFSRTFKKHTGLSPSKYGSL